jgi:TrpR-related protein YerC/YecD
MRISKRFTEDSYQKEPWFRALVAAFQACKTEEDIANFLGDVGTLGELQDWSERFEVAKQLGNGLSYRQVASMTGASTTTVTRVAKSIENGTGGYRKILKIHRHHRKLGAVHKAQMQAALERVAVPSQVSGSVSAQAEEKKIESEAVVQPMTGDLLLKKYLTRESATAAAQEGLTEGGA